MVTAALRAVAVLVVGVVVASPGLLLRVVDYLVLVGLLVDRVLLLLLLLPVVVNGLLAVGDRLRLGLGLTLTRRRVPLQEQCVSRV